MKNETDRHLTKVTTERSKLARLEAQVRGNSVGDAITRARSKGGKAGTLYKPAVVKRLLRSVQSGLTLKQAAVAAGVSETTIHNWKRERPEFLQKLESAREQARENALETIWQARGDDWRAAESFLKYSFWQDYRSGSQVNVQTNTNVEVVKKTFTEEERMALIAQREANQKQLDSPQKPVIEAEIVGGPQCYKAVPDQPVDQPEQTEPVFEHKPEGWDQAHEEVKKQAALFATKEAEQKERDRQIQLDRTASARLFGSED
jgi:hypothetical protein